MTDEKLQEMKKVKGELREQLRQMTALVKKLEREKTKKNPTNSNASDTRRHDQPTTIHQIPKKKRCMRFTDVAFVAGSRANKKRLDTTKRHLPQPTSGREKCQMHRWAAGKECRGRYVVHCPDCYCNLCVFCYSKFHTTGNMFELKKQVENEEKNLNMD